MPCYPQWLRVARWLCDSIRTWGCGSWSSILVPQQGQRKCQVKDTSVSDAIHKPSHWDPQRVCRNTRDLPDTDQEPACTWGNEANAVKQRVNPKSKQRHLPTVSVTPTILQHLREAGVGFQRPQSNRELVPLAQKHQITRLQLPPALKPVSFYHNWGAVGCWKGTSDRCTSKAWEPPVLFKGCTHRHPK